VINHALCFVSYERPDDSALGFGRVLQSLQPEPRVALDVVAVVRAGLFDGAAPLHFKDCGATFSDLAIFGL
jgi:hypothetical protein